MATAYRPELYRTDREGRVIEDLTHLVASGEISMNLDALGSKMALSITLRRPYELKAYRDYVVPRLRLVRHDGTVVDEPIGRYLVVPAGREHSPAMTIGSIDGRDMTAELEADSYPDGYEVASGGDPITAVRAILSAQGLSCSMPLSGDTLAGAITWEPGTSKLDVVNDLLAEAGYYHCWADRYGVITSWRMIELTEVEPSIRYDDAAGSRIVPPISDTPDLSRLCNRVTVIRTDPARSPLTVTVENNDPASPSSTVSLGSIDGSGTLRPRVLSRTVKESRISGPVNAGKLARRYLSEGSSYYRSLKLRTLPDPSRNPREVYELDVSNIDGEVATGRWWCRTWTLPLLASNPAMVHELNRVEPWGEL